MKSLSARRSAIVRTQPSFFLSPVDPRANNLRVFVLMSAVRHVRFLGNATEAINRLDEFLSA